MNPPYTTVPGRDLPLDLTPLEVEVLQSIGVDGAAWAWRFRRDALDSLVERGLIVHNGSLIEHAFYLTDLGDAVLTAGPVPVCEPVSEPDRTWRPVDVSLTAAQEHTAYIEANYEPCGGDR